MDHLRVIASKELELSLTKLELALTKGLFKFQKVLSRISSVK